MLVHLTVAVFDAVGGCVTRSPSCTPTTSPFRCRNSGEDDRVSHVLLLTLFHGRGLFRLILKLATFAGAVALFACHARGPRAGRPGPTASDRSAIVGAWGLRWRYDALLRRLCPAESVEETHLPGVSRCAVAPTLLLEARGWQMITLSELKSDESPRQGRAAPLRGTLAERFLKTGGRPTGFDYLRIILAMSVVALHSVITTKGVVADVRMWETPFRPLLRAVLPMFFALSGFLVAGSLERCRSLVSFLGLRIIRIYPALAVEVLLSALLIGPFVTSVPLASYFADSALHRYFLNILGDIHYALPGVFLTNPVPNAVNLQLWTVPFELGCYVALAAIAILGALRRPYITPLAAVLFSAAYVAARLIKHHGSRDVIVGAVPGPLLIAAFLYGVSGYLYRDRLPYSWKLAAVCAVLGGAFLTHAPLQMGEAVAVPLIVYSTIFLGLCNPRKLAFLRGADYSYGVFLYGFVLQQLVSFILPCARVWWLNLLISLPVAIVVAAISWHFVEKPALRLRRPLLALERRIPRLVGLLRPWPPSSLPTGAAPRPLAPESADR